MTADTLDTQVEWRRAYRTFGIYKKFKCRVVVLRHKVIKVKQTRQAIALAISAMERETVPDTEDYILWDIK